MAVNWTHLSAFHAVAENGSVTAGAERLGVSQPAVSKQVRQLERSLQTRLLDRTAKGVRLTGSGEILAGYARRLFALAEEAEGAMQELSSLRRGSLWIGASHTVGTYLLPQTIVHFRRRFPGITLRLDIEAADALARRVKEDTIDFALTGSHVLLQGEARVFYDDEVIAIAHPRSPLVRRKRLTLGELCEQPLVLDAPGSVPRTLFEAAARAAGVGAVVPAISLAGVEAVKRAVEAGLGVGVVTAIAAADEIRSRRLARLRVQGLAIARPLYHLRPRARRESRAATAFLCLLKHAVRGTLPKLPPG
jgi:DNA-binding transcriptional LysR family regulator